MQEKPFNELKRIQEERPKYSDMSFRRNMNLLCQKGCCSRNTNMGGQYNDKPSYENLEDNEISFVN